MRIVRTIRTIRTVEQVREYTVPALMESEDDIFDYIAGIDEDCVVSEKVIDEVLE